MAETLIWIDLFSLGGLLPHFRPCNDTLEFLLLNFSGSCMYMNEHFLDR